MIRTIITTSALTILLSGCVSTLEHEDNSNNKESNQEYTLIKFEQNKDKIKGENVGLLSNTQRILAFHGSTKVSLEGRASIEGEEKHNLHLSKNRVEKTKSYLINKGINSDRIESIYYGEDNQLITSKDKELTDNRSVMISISEK